jgi:16S rRNA (guanine527-N7)-methyltransferase
MENARIAALLAPFLGGATLSEPQLAQLRHYLELLLRWNARMNLTAVREPEQIVTRHFGESLFAARHLYPPGWKPETGNWKLLDVGSGPGFPGLPIGIWAPAAQVTLLESNHRKATFLREVIRALQLTGVEVLATRAESHAALVNRQSSIFNDGGAPPAANLTVTLRAVERFQHILPTAVRLLENFPAAERRLALLIGGAQLPSARQLAPALTWSDPLPIPQSSHRVLLAGHLR